MRDFLFVYMQYLLPAHLISRLMLRITRCQCSWLKNFFTPWFIRHYGVNMKEAQEEDWRRYESFNAFFTRALKPGVRPMVTAVDAIACPVDGRVSQAGPILGDTLFQAKGHDFSLQTLLGGCPERAQPFCDGQFATLYLSPCDYHRIHMPLDGQLREMLHVPGHLFSVNPATVNGVPSLFARNERIVTLFDTATGPMALVLVGAINVGCIETVWAGVVTPPTASAIRHWDYRDDKISLQRGAEMGRFNMGSTVIVLFGPNQMCWDPAINAGSPVRLGSLLGTLQSSASEHKG